MLIILAYIKDYNPKLFLIIIIIITICNLMSSDRNCIFLTHIPSSERENLQPVVSVSFDIL